MAAAPWIVSDELWSRIEPLLPRVEQRFRYPGRKQLPDRQALQFKRLLVRYDRRADIHEAFLAIACCLVCFKRLQTSVNARSAERACLLSPTNLHPGRA